MVKNLIEDSQFTSDIILSIHRCSMLGNYIHSKQQPPLPLRFKIYRMDAKDSMLQTISKHPFFLYALKECLVSSVRDDFSLRELLLNFNDDWITFEKKVLMCCDSVLRPYAASSSAISAR